MSSTQENAFEITNIKLELAKTKKPSELSPAQRRAILQELNGGKMPILQYDSDIIAIGDKHIGSGVPAINGGGLWYGTALAVPIATEADVDMELQQ